VRDLETHLDLMDAFLSRAAACPVLRPVLGTALRLHIHEITALKLGTGYSPELQAADLALTRAIASFQFRQNDSALATLRDCLSEYHAAALSKVHTHSAIRPLVEFLPRAA
jgi:hypothetical protein